ncbi:MAG: tetratricopeptide repeat protein [Bryobacterales bacterium]|nr:tetratricopeptide repeat protein [Bryobacterales bacterium]
MSQERLDALNALLAQDPNNSFVRYGLAQTLLSDGKLEQAAAAFQELIKLHPNYSAAYFHGGQTLEKLGRLEEARRVYEEGVVVSGRNGDLHTKKEIQGALDLLP